MPKVDATFIVGVLREREKEFWEDDEFARLIEADNMAQAVSVLTDAPYGKWGGEGINLERALESLGKHLHALLVWLEDVIIDERVVPFLSAPYDGLNAATALVQKKRSAEEPGPLSRLGSIPPEVWHGVIWHDVGWERLPEPWGELVREELTRSGAAEEVVKRCGQTVNRRMEQLQFTKLMRDVLALRQERQEDELAIRPARPGFNGTGYEQKWDRRLLEIIRPYRYDVEGYNWVMGFWYAKELEVKTIRLLLSAKNVGWDKAELRQMKFPLPRFLN